MTPEEREALKAKLQATSALFGHRMRDDVADAYARAVEEVPVQRLLLALDRYARTAESTSRFPMPRELAQRARGAWHEPAHGLTDAEADRLHQRVFREMAAWERAHPTGSARPAFEGVWRDACRAEGIRSSPLLAQAREGAWQTWLKSGPPLTRDRMVEHLAAIAPRAHPSLLGRLATLVDKLERGDQSAAPDDQDSRRDARERHRNDPPGAEDDGHPAPATPQDVAAAVAALRDAAVETPTTADAPNATRAGEVPDPDADKPPLFPEF